MTIGERIKLRRNELGLTQTELAKRMGLTSKTTICKAETIEFNPTMDRVKEFAKALETTPAYLMGWEDEAKAFRDKTAEFQYQYLLAKKSGNTEKAKLYLDLINELNEKHNESFESFIDNVIEVNNPELQRAEKALDFYDKYLKADPNIKAAIENLLKDTR